MPRGTGGAMANGLILVAAIVVGTWNGNWFPSGRAEHRAHPDVEAATISAAAKMLAGGLQEVDPAGTNDIILCLNEIRGPKVASNLVAQIGARKRFFMEHLRRSFPRSGKRRFIQII